MDVPKNIIPALILTAIAGLSTGIGSAIAYFIRKPKIIYLSFSLGLSAGVMIYVSFMELLPRAIETVTQIWGIAAFFIGIAFIGLIDMLIPEAENPHDYKGLNDTTPARVDESLMRTALFTALAIGIHNFPEGLATFGTTLSDVKLGVFIAIAIAIHNIPEGISVSMPIFYATGNKNKAFFYSFLSGIAEPFLDIATIFITASSCIPFGIHCRNYGICVFRFATAYGSPLWSRPYRHFRDSPGYVSNGCESIDALNSGKVNKRPQCNSDVAGCRSSGKYRFKYRA
jgi:ZIP family zinc transporter